MENLADLKFSSCFQPRIAGAGLLNLGNTCFLNVVLQCLVHTVPLVQKLRLSEHYSSCRLRGSDSDEFCALCALKHHVNDCLYMSGFVIAPRRFAFNLNRISSYFLLGQQEDAHELLHYLLDNLHSCCLNHAPTEKPLSLEEDSLINDVFGGRLRSQLRCCDCGHTSDTYEPLLDLSLEIGNAYSLMDALESFTKVEKIDDSDINFICEGCKAIVSVEKQLKLDRAPQVLALQLKRFKSFGTYARKNDKFVEYPMELDLNPFLSCPADEGELKYDLYAIIVHLGDTPLRGHYISFVRSSETEFVHINDAHVFRCPKGLIENQKAYMLFYIKQGSSPWFSSLMKMEKTMIAANPLPYELDRRINRRRIAGENGDIGSNHHAVDEDDDKENGYIPNGC